MKKILNTAFLILIFLTFSLKSGAVVLDGNYLKEQIKKDVEKQIKATLKEKSTVEIVNIPYEKIEINGEKNQKVEIETKINLKYFNPLTLVRVNILVNGESQKSFVAQAKISVYDKVWVAKDYIKRGEALTKVALEEKDITYLPKTIMGERSNPCKYASRKNYKPGDAIDSVFMESIPAIAKYSPVSVIFKTQSVSITIPATALDDGNIGDFIKVRSKNYKKDYMGKIINENMVLVNI